MAILYSSQYQEDSIPIPYHFVSSGIGGTLQASWCWNIHSCRYGYKSRHFIIPVILYSLLYNLPKFFELTTSCPEPAHTNQTLDTSETPSPPSLLSSPPPPPEFLGGCQYGNLALDGRDLRVNYWYLTIYLLWMNTVLNVLFPIISLIILNILIYRYSYSLVKLS